LYEVGGREGGHERDGKREDGDETKNRHSKEQEQNAPTGRKKKPPRFATTKGREIRLLNGRPKKRGGRIKKRAW